MFNFYAGNNETFRMVSATTNVNYHEFDGSATGNPLQWIAAGTDTNINMAIMPKGTGNLGVANSNPQYKLDIAGSLNLNSTSTAFLNGKLAVSTSTPWRNSWDYGTAIATSTIITGTTTIGANNTLVVNTNEGRVGIGTTAPGAKLEVNGTFSAISGTTTDSMSMLHASSSTYNLNSLFVINSSGVATSTNTTTIGAMKCYKNNQESHTTTCVAI
jgi:hypothetical protein